MRRMVQVGVGLAVASVLWGCGGSSAAPTSPTPSGGGGGATTTIAILGNDDEAFRPSPANAPKGSVVVWASSDDSPHRIVATDGSFDTGVLAPNARSAPIVIGTDGANYYCTIHPGEHGSLNASNGVPPPCTGPHCG